MATGHALDGATVFVTGAGGFLGQALVERLGRMDVELHALYHSDPDAGETPPGVRPHVGSIVDGEFLDDRLRAVEADYVFHLAARTAPADDLERVNVEGTRNVLEAATSVDADGLVFTSSAKRYAPAESRREETDPIRPKTRYGVSKRAGELLCRSYHDQCGIPIAIAIPFLLYGPAEYDPRGLVPAAIESALADSAFEVQCREHVRDPVFVSDAVGALLRAVGRFDDREELVFNVCRGEPLTVRSVVASIFDIVESDTDPTYAQRPACREETAHLVGDPTGAAESLGWTASVGWEAGIRRTIDSFRRATPE